MPTGHAMNSFMERGSPGKELMSPVRASEDQRPANSYPSECGRGLVPWLSLAAQPEC